MPNKWYAYFYEESINITYLIYGNQTKKYAPGNAI